VDGPRRSDERDGAHGGSRLKARTTLS